MNTTPVYIVGDENGSIITVSPKNPDFGWLTLRQDSTLIINGWANKKSLTTIIMGQVDVLETMDLAAGEVLTGKIVIVEKLEPFSTSDRDLKIAGSSNVVCKLKGQPIYRKTFYTVDSTANNVLIAHDNIDEIRNSLSNNNSKDLKVLPNTTNLEELVDAFNL